MSTAAIAGAIHPQSSSSSQKSAGDEPNRALSFSLELQHGMSLSTLSMHTFSWSSRSLPSGHVTCPRLMARPSPSCPAQ